MSIAIWHTQSSNGILIGVIYNYRSVCYALMGSDFQ